MPAPSRIKACARCRQHKLRCDAYQHPGQQCSRCRRMHLDCSITGNPRQPKGRQAAELTEQTSQLDQRLNTVGDANAILNQVSSDTSLEQSQNNTNDPISAIIPAPEEVEQIAPRPFVARRQPPIKETRVTLHNLNQLDLDPAQVKSCFSQFMSHYSDFLHGIFDKELEPEIYLDKSPLLFWSIVATGARNLSEASDLFVRAVIEIKEHASLALFTVTNPIPAIQAALILCLWPIPVDTMWKDPSHAFAGAAHGLAVQHGLFAISHEQDFRRTQTTSSQNELTFQAHLWLHCSIHFQSTSLCDGLPFLAISEPRLSGRDSFLNMISNPSLLYRYRCHQVMINAMLSISGSIDMEGEDDTALLSLIKVFDTQVQSIALPLSNDMCLLTQQCTRLAIMAHAFFIRSYEIKTSSLLNVFSIATKTLDLISKLDVTQDFAYYATSFYLRMTLLAAFCIIRVIRSRLSGFILLRDAEQSLFKAIAFAKKRSIQRGDLDERYAMILTQLWSNSGAVSNKEDLVDGLYFKIRSRLFMSIVFDTLWWWRTECDGQSSPYDDRTHISAGPPTNETLPAFDAMDDSWNNPNIVLDEAPEYPILSLEGLIDWNWPSNLSFPMYNIE